ncbi:glycoside hydrolase family protein [Asticcacaulis sp. AC402]|uniref:glycoside hydrolase family protein n=1 Tax=Asticcacaulis sp. AC402 TaxID=1282361 RepID=UPI0003C3F912|nr:glycoside hydrolase family protein [Asticcacaulis sp. AC402]ESQ76583.1 muraminidase [Asticcacaulis sp. AC402]
MRARQKVSRAGVELIKSFEGLRSSAARLPDGRWTLGYGHTFSAREGAKVTQEDADALLRFDLLPIVDTLNNLVLVPLNQNQFDALVSFCFNIGADNFGQSTVLKRINEGRMTEAALAMDAWRSAEFNGQTYVLAPLIRRRAAEKNLFLTPDEASGNAPTLLVRPVEDSGGAAVQTSELNSPDRGGILSAYPVGVQQAPEPTVMPTVTPHVTQPSALPADMLSPYARPAPATFGMPASQPLVQPLAQPMERVVESLPEGLVASSAMRETPVREETTSPYASVAGSADLEPQMSPEVAAAIARAQEEQRLRDEALRQSQALAASRAADEARLMELQRLELARLEQARLEQAHLEHTRLEYTRLEQAHLERARLEQARLEQENLERERLAAAEAMRLEQIRLEQERLDRERAAEAARAEQERLEFERAASAAADAARREQGRLEQERLERERASAEAARLEQARLEDERREREAREREAMEREAMEREAREREAREREAREREAREREARDQAARDQATRDQAAATAQPSSEEAEKIRKAEAAAALMRLYSPYGGGALGRPLGSPMARPAPAPTPAPAPAPVSTPAPEEFINHSVIAPQSSQSTPIEISSRPESIATKPEPEVIEDEPAIGGFTPFKPVVSPSAMPAPVITALNPYAKPIGARVEPQPAAVADVVEVPRPKAVDLASAPVPDLFAKPVLVKPEPLKVEPLKPEPVKPEIGRPAQSAHWREQLQRPLPEGYRGSDTVQPEQQGSLLSAATYEDDNNAWTLDGDRIALSSEEMHEEGASWGKMIARTMWWIFISVIGLACLGVGAAAWFKYQDPSVARLGMTEDFRNLSIISAALGIFFVSVSVWLIMKRLGGLKD